MKNYRMALAILFIVALLALTGCNKTYFFSFKKEQSLGNAEGDWILEDDDDWGFTSKGFTAQDSNVACPFRFSGDLTYIVTFYINADEDHPISFGVCLGDGTWYDTTVNDVHIDFRNIGTEQAYYFIGDHSTGDTYTHYDEEGLPAGLRLDSYNAFKLIKCGDKMRLFFNGEEFAAFELQNYASEWFGPNVWMREDFVPLDDGYGFFLESVGVTYPTGNISDMI